MKKREHRFKKTGSQKIKERERDSEASLRHLEIKLVTLVAEIFAFLVSHMAVGAVQLILVMRGEVRIRGLHVLRLRDERLRRMALRALLDVRRIEFRGVALAVAHFAVHAAGMCLSAPNLSAAAAVPAARKAAQRAKTKAVRVIGGFS